MERKLRVLGTVTLLAVGAGVLSGCGLLFRSSFEDDIVLDETAADAITSVRIDTSNGGVTLHGDDTATEVSIHRRVEHAGDRPEDPSHRVEDGVLVLGDCGRHCSVEYTVDLPAGLAVAGESDNGEIILTDVGEVDVHTKNGEIAVDGAGGPVTAETDNGKVAVDGAGGPVTVETDNGEIEVILDTPQDVRAHTDNGEITLTVPDGDYQVSTETDNGDLDVGIATDPAGTHLLDLASDNGSITVRPA